MIALQNRWLIFALKLAVTFTILWLVVRQLDLGMLERRVEMIATGWLGLAFALFLIQVLLNSWRWCILARLDDVELTLRRAFRMYLEAMFVNQALPTSFGGDVVRIYYVSKLGYRLGQAINGVLLDRLAGAIGLIILMIGGLVPFFGMVTNTAARIGFATVPALASLALGALLLLSLIRTKVPSRFSEAITHFARLARRMLLQPRTAVPALGVAMIGHATMVTGTWFLAKAFALEVDWLACFTIVPAAVLIAMMPVSIAGWGLREGAMAAGFALIGIGAESGFFLSVAVGLMLVAVGLLGGVVWLFRGPGAVRWKSTDVQEHDRRTILGR
jgi:uncharacterized protein (TIRG00374 family)